MDKINWIRFKRPVMPNDFNNMQTGIEETQKKINKYIIGSGLISGGNISFNTTTKILTISPFTGLDNSGNLIKSDETNTLNITPYINNDLFFSIIATYDRQPTGSELDFDNVIHHYKELDNYQITLKPGEATFPIIEDNELLLADIQSLISGQVLVKTNRVKKLTKIEECISATDIINKDNAILQLAKNYADIIGNGSLSIQGLFQMCFDNVVTNGDFTYQTTGWTQKHSNPIQLINGNNENGLFGNILKITRTNADSQKLVLTGTINTKLIAGKEICLRAKLKIDELIGNANNSGIRIKLVGLDENNTEINAVESQTVDNTNWTQVNIKLEILPEYKSVEIQVELDYLNYIGYIAEVSANYGTTAVAFSKSMNEMVAKLLQLETTLQANIENLGALNILYNTYFTNYSQMMTNLTNAFNNHVHTALNTKPTAFQNPVT